MPRFSITINKMFDGTYGIIYSGLKIDSFVSFLKDFNIKSVIDYMKKIMINIIIYILMLSLNSKF